MKELLESLPEGTRTAVINLINLQRTKYSIKNTIKLNFIGQQYGFRWCKRGMHIEHLSEFGTRANGQPQSYCKAHHREFTAEYNLLDHADYQGPRGEYQEGGIAGEQVITDEERDAINEFFTDERDRVYPTFTKKKKKKHGFIKTLLFKFKQLKKDLYTKYFTKDIVTNEDLSNAYKQLSINKPGSIAYIAHANKIKEVDYLGFFLRSIKGQNWCYAEKLVKKIEKVCGADHGFTYDDFERIIWKKTNYGLDIVDRTQIPFDGVKAIINVVKTKKKLWIK